MDFTTRFHGQEFANPLMNASGVWCYDDEELDAMGSSASGAVVTKSATTNFREGNPEPRYQSLPLGSINSMGLPNKGLDFYLDYVIRQQESSATNAQKFQFVSIAGTSPEEDILLLKKIQASDYKGFVELNLSCPNVPGKPQMAYDIDATRALLEEIFSFFDQPLGIKLPPFFDLVHFDLMADVLNDFPLAFVNCINSVGNGLIVDVHTERVVIHPKNGFGGIGGPYVLPTALANVRAYAERLKPSIRIIGTGGVESGEEVFLHLLCGADMVQVGTQLQKEGPAVFDRLLKELGQIMEEKGYKSIDEFRGKVRNYAGESNPRPLA
ncbi:dihydroorotate oxidase [Atopobacter sp. AH10]|uniref:dihydroorotate oxidase n=1 Tax=Atopobacter sp. AH10 TaxID=2315861 RepID=UPI000EF1D020|nr:dihydroorotate oxidase [Atopobacter sp. AH10]RLK64260.1 dihydroorotate oxidase [Atopobacter sp. AH10]